MISKKLSTLLKRKRNTIARLASVFRVFVSLSVGEQQKQLFSFVTAVVGGTEPPPAYSKVNAYQSFWLTLTPFCFHSSGCQQTTFAIGLWSTRWLIVYQFACWTMSYSWSKSCWNPRTRTSRLSAEARSHCCCCWAKASCRTGELTCNSTSLIRMYSHLDLLWNWASSSQHESMEV